VVVAHDYSVSVAQERLTRRAAGARAVDLRAVHFTHALPVTSNATQSRASRLCPNSSNASGRVTSRSVV